MGLKGYKAFNKDLTCRGFQYEIGKTYEIDEKPKTCKRGFHFCASISECYEYYPKSDDTRICEIEALGDVDTDDNKKYATNKIAILYEILEENIKKGNVGSSNSGYRNSGDCNSGYRNSGDCNSGDCNSGDRNSGYRNSGDRNSGDWNSGDWNSGDRNSGLFNTEKNPKLKIFDKESEWTYEDWMNSKARRIMNTCPYTYSNYISESEMTDNEKENRPEYKTIGGYVKVFIATKEDKKKWWDDLSEDDKNTVKSLPNFDWDKFVKCVGM